MSPEELRRAEEHAAFRVVADSTYGWESWVTPDGRLRWVNPAVTRLAGYTVAECLAMADYPLAVIHEDDREWMAELLEGARAGSSGNDLEFRVRRKDGTRRWAAMSWQPIVIDGEPAGYRSSVRDVHERRRLEDRLRQARREAVAAERLRTTFLANLSLELRSPLQCVLAAVELVRDGDLDERGRGWAQIIEEQTVALLRQVEDLVQFVPHDAASVLRPRRMDLHDLCARAIAAIAPGVEARGVAARCQVEATLPRWVMGDAERLSQILANLLSNAARLTARGAISLSVSWMPSRSVAFTVRDTGSGIPAEVLARMRRADFARSAGALDGGLGLALVIVERIAAQMNGRVTVESLVGRGTAVSVIVPLAEVSAPSDTVPRGTVADSESPGLRVLVVDDSAPARELAIATITSLGYRVAATASADGALLLLREKVFDLVLMDYRLAGSDGITAAREIRKDLAVSGRTITIVLLTADAFVEACAEEHDAPVDLVVTKPLRRDQLYDVLRAAASGQLEGRKPRKRAEPRGFPVLDREVVRELQATKDASGRSLFERLSRKVIAQVCSVLAQLEASRHALTTPAVAVLAHRAKGDCLTIGARAAARAAGAVEDAALCEDGVAAESALDALMKAWADARVTMEGEMESEVSEPRSA